MLKKFTIASVFLFSSFLLGCQSETPLNANTNVSNSVGNLDPSNMPPGLSGNTVTTPGNAIPGIPDANSINSNNLPKGATPTPGIPANPGKPLPKGATPTPGIPDPATLKKQMDQISNTNPTNPTNSNGSAANGAQPRAAGKP